MRRQFTSSGKFRLNANGKRLDAWLIYNCTHCDSSWNLVVFERKHARDIAPELIQKLQSNNMQLADSIAMAAPSSGRFAPSEQARAEYSIESDKSELFPPCKIVISVRRGQVPRLDLLLADQLGMSRRAVVAHAKSGKIQIEAPSREPLRRPVADGTVITLKEVQIYSRA